MNVLIVRTVGQIAPLAAQLIERNRPGLAVTDFVVRANSNPREVSYRLMNLSWAREGSPNIVVHPFGDPKLTPQYEVDRAALVSSLVNRDGATLFLLMHPEPQAGAARQEWRRVEEERILMTVAKTFSLHNAPVETHTASVVEYLMMAANHGFFGRYQWNQKGTGLLAFEVQPLFSSRRKAAPQRT